MKKTITLLFLATLLVSCGASKTERNAEKTFKGDWILNSISYPNSDGFVDVTLFNDASANCFRNSEWHFISNNHKGSYSLYGENCTSGKRNFVWDVQTVDAESGSYNFTLKPVGEKENARKLDTGYQLKLVSISENSLVLEQQVSYQGKAFLIRMNFIKK